MWSWALALIGVTGLYLVTRRDWRGYAIGVAVQALWVAYAVVTAQWGFILSALVYGAVNTIGLVGWRREARVARPVVPFVDYRCGCGDLSSEHTNGGWGDCTKCGCTDGIYSPPR